MLAAERNAMMATSLMSGGPKPQPLPAVTPLAIASIYDSGEDLFAGRGLTLWVYLNGPAPSPGATLIVTSSNDVIALPQPGTIHVAAGETWVAAPIRTLRAGLVMMMITLGQSTRTYQLEVLDPTENPR